MDIRYRFGRRIRALRTEAGLTQKDLALMVGLSLPSMCNIERGAYAPSFQKLDALARALGVEIHDLFRLEPPSTRATSADGRDPAGD